MIRVVWSLTTPAIPIFRVLFHKIWVKCSDVTETKKYYVITRSKYGGNKSYTKLIIAKVIVSKLSRVTRDNFQYFDYLILSVRDFFMHKTMPVILVIYHSLHIHLILLLRHVSFPAFKITYTIGITYLFRYYLVLLSNYNLFPHCTIAWIRI